MMAPRALFAGSSALDACLGRDACLRGVLLHGLSLGLDADPGAIDALADDDEQADGEEDVEFGEVAFEEEAFDEVLGPVGHGGGYLHDMRFPPRRGAGGEPRLFTATVVHDDGREMVHAFHASLAVDEAEIAGRLFMRMGAVCADAAIVRGFDHTSPIVEALVSQALCDTLMMIDAEPGSRLAAGLDLNVEQRFAA